MFVSHSQDRCHFVFLHPVVYIVSNTTVPNITRWLIIIVLHIVSKTPTWASQHIHAVRGEVSLGIIKVGQNKIKSILVWKIKNHRCISHWSFDPLSKLLNFNVAQHKW